MKFHIMISCDNSAFDDSIPAELLEILAHQITPHLVDGVGKPPAQLVEEKLTLRDSNGNPVGSLYFTRT